MGRESYELWLVGRGYTKATITGYTKVYRLWGEWCAVQGTTTEKASRGHLARWLLERRTRTPSTIRNAIIGVRAYYRYLLACKTRRDDPTAGLRWPKVTLPPIRPYTSEELTALLDAATTLRDRALILLLLDSGLRISEAASIESPDVDWGRGVIRIRHGKGGGVRNVALGKKALAALRDYRASVHGSFWGNISSTESLRRSFFRLAKRAGVERGNVHRFRHTYAASFLLGGGSEGQLQTILGHKSLAMSLHYGEAARETVALDAQRRLSPGDRL